MPGAPGPSTLAMAIEAVFAVLPFLAIGILNVYFALRGWPPLTQVVEDYLRRYPLFAAGLGGFAGALVGHVFWSFGDNPAGPPAPFRLLLLAIGAAAVLAVGGAGLLALIAWWIQTLLPGRFGDDRSDPQPDPEPGR